MESLPTRRRRNGVSERQRIVWWAGTYVCFVNLAGVTISAIRHRFVLSQFCVT